MFEDFFNPTGYLVPPNQDYELELRALLVNGPQSFYDYLVMS